MITNQEQQSWLRRNIISPIEELFKSESSKQAYADCLIYNSKGELLLLQRSGNDTFGASKWCLPGGKIDDGENALQAVLREVKEEIGIQLAHATEVHTVYRSDSTTTYFQVWAYTLPYLVIDNEEHYQYKWCPIQELDSMDLLLDLGKILKESKLQPSVYMVEEIDQNKLTSIEELLKPFDDAMLLIKNAFDNDNVTPQDYAKYKSKHKLQKAKVTRDFIINHPNVTDGQIKKAIESYNRIVKGLQVNI